MRDKRQHRWLRALVTLRIRRALVVGRVVGGVEIADARRFDIGGSNIACPRRLMDCVLHLLQHRLLRGRRIRRRRRSRKTGGVNVPSRAPPIGNRARPITMAVQEGGVERRDYKCRGVRTLLPGAIGAHDRVAKDMQISLNRMEPIFIGPLHKYTRDHGKYQGSQFIIERLG